MTARTSKLATMRKTVADRIGLDIDNPAVTDIARLELAMAAEDAALETGRNFNSTNILNLRAALHDAYKAAGALQPRKVEIAIVQGVQGFYECVHCQGANYLAPDRYEPLTGHYEAQKSKPDAAPATENKDARKATETNADALKAAPAPTLAPTVAKRVLGSIHDGVTLPSGVVELAPLKKNQPMNWHRNPDPNDAPAPAQELAVIR
jgi:hypothetical protein